MKGNRNQYDRERKREQRALNTDYAVRVREAKRSEYAKARRKELRERESSKEKERLYAIEYRKRPEVRLKNKAREQVKLALANGKLVRPNSCESCGKSDDKLKDGRSSLRADHYMGYEKEHHLTVKFICIQCDGIQLRKEYPVRS